MPARHVVKHFTPRLQSEAHIELQLHASVFAVLPRRVRADPKQLGYCTAQAAEPGDEPCLPNLLTKTRCDFEPTESLRIHRRGKLRLEWQLCHPPAEQHGESDIPSNIHSSRQMKNRY